MNFRAVWKTDAMRAAGLLVLVGFLLGCRTQLPAARNFRFPADALAVTNETAWVYGLDAATGKRIHTPRVPPPTYALHCFVLARTAKQFHAHADFLPAEPRLTEVGYRDCLAAVLARSPRSRSRAGDRLPFPGFADLYSFSAAYPDMIRRQAGGAWQSYLQRGHWRMILPFSHRGQQAEARRLAKEIRSGEAPVVHLCEFPRLRLNHAVLLYHVETNPEGLLFSAYDPNDPGRPVMIQYHNDRGFVMPAVPYFAGGAVKAYEVYRSWNR